MELAKEQLEIARKRASVLALEAELEKQKILELLEEVKNAEESFNSKEAKYEATKIDIGIWRAILAENGESKYSSDFIFWVLRYVAGSRPPHSHQISSQNKMEQRWC